MYVKTNGCHKYMLHKSLYKFAPYLISLKEHVLYYSYKSNYNLNHIFFFVPISYSDSEKNNKK